MTAYDIYKRTCSLMLEDEGEDSTFKKNFTGILNSLICEALPYENSVRRSRGEKELTSAPEVKEEGDVVDMCEEICTVALPYGVMAYFCGDDGEIYASGMYRNRFISALEEASKASDGEVIDMYEEEI